MTTKAADKSASRRPLQLCLFDARRGDREGEEHDKLLGYFPADVPTIEQCRTVGLVQASQTFLKTFDGAGPCDSLQFASSQWVLTECEADIWLVVAAAATQRHKGGGTHLNPHRAVLRQLHRLLRALHGPLQQLLTQDTSGEAARQAVGPTLAEFGARLSRQGSPEYLALHNPLASFGSLPYLHLPTPIFTGVHSLVSRCLVCPTSSGAPVAGAVLLHEDWLLWSTVDQDTTAALHELLAWTVLPASKEASSSKAVFGSRQSGAGVPAARPVALLSRSAWTSSSKGLVLLSKAAQQQEAAARQEGLQLPPIWVQGLQEWCSLLVLRVAEQLLAVLLPEALPATEAFIESCLGPAAASMKTLSESVAQHLQAKRHLHVPKFRYLFVDELTGTMAASPSSKVATLTRSSLALLGSVLADVETQSADEQDESAEVIAWGQHDCWVVARRCGGRRICVVLEHQGKDGLPEADRAVRAFEDEHFPGYFL